MDLYTIQIPKWNSKAIKAVYSNLKFVDITIKSGMVYLAPTWGLLSDYKSGKITDKEYTDIYLELMRDRYKNNKDLFYGILNSDTPIVLGCYCKAGDFCHRHLLVDIVSAVARKQGLPFEYKGEITKEGVK